MNISATISYPASTSLAEVYELSTDPDFRAAVCEATHALDYDVRVDEHEDGTSTVVVSRTMPADVPDFMKKMIGESVDVIQTEDWSTPDRRRPAHGRPRGPDQGAAGQDDRHGRHRDHRCRR